MRWRRGTPARLLFRQSGAVIFLRSYVSLSEQMFLFSECRKACACCVGAAAPWQAGQSFLPLKKMRGSPFACRTDGNGRPTVQGKAGMTDSAAGRRGSRGSGSAKRRHEVRTLKQAACPQRCAETASTLPQHRHVQERASGRNRRCLKVADRRRSDEAEPISCAFVWIVPARMLTQKCYYFFKKRVTNKRASALPA